MNLIITQANRLDDVDIEDLAEFEKTWERPLAHNAESWIRDGLDYLLKKFQRPKLGMFSEQLLKHNNIFLNLVIILRFKGRGRMKQQTWTKDAVTNEHNKDLCAIEEYYAKAK
jgi:hypothetical protein